MRRNLPIDELASFLDARLAATLATYRLDGSILLSPVWHEWRDGGFNVIVGIDDVKARHLRRDPRAGLVVYQNEAPYAGVEIHTTARLIEAGAAEVARRIAVRYLGEKEGDEFAGDGEGNLIVRLEPGTLRTWDFADDVSLTQ